MELTSCKVCDTQVIRIYIICRYTTFFQHIPNAQRDGEHLEPPGGLSLLCLPAAEQPLQQISPQQAQPGLLSIKKVLTTFA